MRGTETPRVERNPGMLAGSGVRLRGGERSQGEETELKMGRLGEVEASGGRRDTGEAGRGREEYKERGAGVRAKAGGDTVGEGEREGDPFWGW